MNIPAEMNLDTLLFGAGSPEDFPQLDLAGFDRLHIEASPYQLEWLNRWIGPQATCDLIMRQVGTTGLSRVLVGIAKASSVHKVHMSDRVASIAAYYNLQVF